MGSCCLAAVFKEPSRSPSSSGSWPDFTHLPTLWLSGLLGSVALFQELCDLLLPRRTDGRHGAEEIDHPRAAFDALVKVRVQRVTGWRRMCGVQTPATAEMKRPVLCQLFPLPLLKRAGPDELPFPIQMVLILV